MIWDDRETLATNGECEPARTPSRYYDSHADKRAAVRDLNALRDLKRLLADSG